MEICPIRPDECAEFIAFLNVGMRSDASATRVEDDFPAILAAENCRHWRGIRGETGWIAGLTTLTRPFVTSAGTLAIAGIGSVVTREDHRGQGLSGKLQRAALGDLAADGVALAVLWTDRPEIYAARGFGPAGWEYHLDLESLPAAIAQPTGTVTRPLTAADTAGVAKLYAAHPLRTVRDPSDHQRLYEMPGTLGLGQFEGADLVAYAFCGKGADFPDYVAEWGGTPAAALAVLAEVRRAQLASRALVPTGREDLLESAVAAGAGFCAVPSGLWAVLRPDLLAKAVGREPKSGDGAAAAWLGTIGPDEVPKPGLLRVAVWGFDSV